MGGIPTVFPAAVVGVSEVANSNFSICQTHGYNGLVTVIGRSHTACILIARFIGEIVYRYIRQAT